MNRFRLWLAVTAIILSSVAYANQDLLGDEVGEGFDRQTPEEIERANQIIERDFAGQVLPMHLSAEERAKILEKYAHLDPKKEVPTSLLEETVLYFDANKDRFPNQAYVAIVDFKPRSNKHRFFLVDMATGAVEKYRTTHGIGSDKDNNGYAEKFGNIPDSGMSSLGFARTAEVYWGKYKRSLRLDGLSSTNSKIRQRAIVFHGWDNVKEADRIQGRSWGCITLDWDFKDAVLDKIKEGALMYSGVAK